MYWSNEVKDSKKCPTCGSTLEKEYHSYIMVVWINKEPAEFVVGNDKGYFCPTCPLVVLDKEYFKKLITIGLGQPEAHDNPTVKFAVAGIVDMDRIPDDKKSKPLGTHDNPIPLVRFLERKEEAIVSKKIGRNQTCPCGSGEKYKKCCGRI